MPDLGSGELEVIGRLTEASNATLYALLHRGTDQLGVVYKPRSGERPLWDFADGTLHRREVACYRLDVAGGFGVVPTTVLRDGPFGPGSVQRWVGPAPGEPVEAGAGVVDVVHGAPPTGWLRVVDAEDYTGRAVVLCHADDEELARMAVLDVLANNADRKGGHVVRDHDGALFGVDHGLTFHEEPKLRTVLWGWSGRRVPRPLLDRVARVLDGLSEGSLGEELAALLDEDEVGALRRRAQHLLDTGRFPRHSGMGPSIPWPAF